MVFWDLMAPESLQLLNTLPAVCQRHPVRSRLMVMIFFEEPKEAKRAIGYLPEIPPLYTNETPEEYLKFVAEAKGLKGKKWIVKSRVSFPRRESRM